MPRRQRLIARRRELQISCAEVARRFGRDVGTYRRYENGESTPRSSDWGALAEALEWTPVDLAIALGDDVPLTNHAVPGWLGRLGDIEQSSARMAAWEPLVVHGLLQTAPYALAVERADAAPKGEDAIVRRVESRLRRQQALHRIEPLRLAVILDESVLLRPAGGGQVMADQLDHLATVAERPNVTLRVLPLEAARFSAAFGAFSLFWQPTAPAPWMAVTEDRAGPHYHDADHHPQDVAAHARVFDHLAEHSLPLIDTLDLIQRHAKEYR